MVLPCCPIIAREVAGRWPMRLPALLVTACLNVLVAGCGSDTTGGGSKDSGTMDVAPDLGGTTDDDQLVGSDTSPDATPDGAATDGSDTVQLGSDTTTTDSDDTNNAPKFTCNDPGGAGCACTAAQDCNSGFCIDTPGQGKICTTTCSGPCPDEFTCALAPGGDVIYICLPRWPVYCNPCDVDEDCASAGVGKSTCVDRGSLGKFCGAACTADSDCPAGGTCQQTTSASGKTGLQCMPAPGAGGVAAECTCSPAARLAQLGTTCGASDGGSGSCTGVRQCTEEGLSACSAILKPEVCNGVDDDCDGSTDETACDDKNPCTVDTCGAAGCSFAPTPGTCDADGNACTVGDACDSGLCKAGPSKVCDDQNGCTLDVCNPVSGCQYTPDDGVGCSDGDPCSVGDLCKTGQCQPGAPKICGQGDACTTPICNGTSGLCEPKPKSIGTLCDDGSACTENDKCLSGACIGIALICNDNNACTTDTCQPGSGCGYSKISGLCDDGNACTTSDQCYDGKCFGTSNTDQCNDNNACTNDSCDPLKGCQNANNTGSCNDGDACTANDSCSQGECKGGSSVCQCQSDSDCTDDGNLCNGVLICDKSTTNYQCKVKPGSVVICSVLNVCAPEICQPASGTCLPTPNNGKACSDGSVCTTSDECEDGQCFGGGSLTCDDGNPCTSDNCDTVSGCQSANSPGQCTDNNACTTGETCSDGKCLGASAKVCNDNNTCTIDSCDPTSGTCVFNAAAADGSACDDGNACTTGDACSGGGCVTTGLLDCEDGNPCVVNSCEPALGCKNVPEPNGEVCGELKACKAGQCVDQPKCGDGFKDLDEECDPGDAVDTGCVDCLIVGVAPAKGDLIVSEVMAAPTNTSDEWFELYNPTGKWLLLDGLDFGDNFGIEAFATGTIVAPNKYLLLARKQLVGGAIIPDVYYGTNVDIALNNDGDYVCVATPQQGTKACTAGGQYVIAFKEFAKSSVLSGYSYQLSSTTMTSEGAAISGNWCWPPNSATYGTQSSNRGTPGSANKICQ
jgi:hypothetical protein